MYQSFTSIADPSHGSKRIAALRKWLQSHALDGVLVPRADEFQGEYVPPSADRLRWLTGFSGSAGFAIATADKAAVFVDGRYTVQVRNEVDLATFEIAPIPASNAGDWIVANLRPGARFGLDPRLHTIAEAERLGAKLDKAGIELKLLDENPVDAIWSDRPAPPCAPIEVHPLELAGVSAEDKLAALQKTLIEAGQSAVVLSLPDSIAWLFNIRGRDIAHNPVVLAFAIVPSTGRAKLFVDPRKIGPAAEKYLDPLADCLAPEQLQGALVALGDTSGVEKKPAKGRAAAGTIAEAKVRLDPETASLWFKSALEAAGAEIALAPDPCRAPKAIKNAAEIAGARAAHLRDGAAVCRFLAWLSRTATKGGVDEIGAAKKLESLRSATNALRDISFDTISGAGANGAIVHYRVSEKTNRKLCPGELYLVDSGAQYVDGTTDITRTVSIGEPADENTRRMFTLVLKGHVAISTARFPVGTRGVELDPLARRPLWQAGFDFDHGTGHGIGSYLSVHEGPPGISRRAMTELLAGMLLSNEPGYYREGAYGIRTENLVLVAPAETPEGGERPMLSFETVTLAPYDQRLIDVALLETGELDWINAYHARVLEEIGPLLGATDRAWLKRATQPIKPIRRTRQTKSGAPSMREKLATPAGHK